MQAPGDKHVLHGSATSHGGRDSPWEVRSICLKTRGTSHPNKPVDNTATRLAPEKGPTPWPQELHSPEPTSL